MMNLKLAFSSILTFLILIILTNACLARDRVSLGFLQGTWDGIELVSRTGGAINQVAPCWFLISSTGNLYLTDDMSHSFVDSMHEKGVLVTPFISNHWDREKGKVMVLMLI